MWRSAETGSCNHPCHEGLMAPYWHRCRHLPQWHLSSTAIPECICCSEICSSYCTWFPLFFVYMWMAFLFVYCMAVLKSSPISHCHRCCFFSAIMHNVDLSEEDSELVSAQSADDDDSSEADEERARRQVISVDPSRSQSISVDLSRFQSISVELSRFQERPMKRGSTRRPIQH